MRTCCHVACPLFPLQHALLCAVLGTVGCSHVCVTHHTGLRCAVLREYVKLLLYKCTILYLTEGNFTALSYVLLVDKENF
jgi:hypothetical protein